MRKDDVELLREIQKNTQMGLHALEIMESKVYDDKLSLQLIRESFKYGELHDRAKAQLLAAKQMPEPENKVAKAMLSVSINGSTLLNTTTGHLADLMIKGSNMGLSSLWRALNPNGQAGEQSMELASELMDFEENNIKELRKYL